MLNHGVTDSSGSSSCGRANTKTVAAIVGTADERAWCRANTKHGRYKCWRAHREKEKYYFGEIKRIMKEAREAGLIPGD